MPVGWGQSAKFRVQSAKCSFCPHYSFLCHPGAHPRKNECFCGVHFDPRIQVICITSYFFKYVSRCDRLIDWIATPSAMARNDKRVWSLFVPCHREGATRPWRSSECDMCRCATAPITWIPWSSHGMTKKKYGNESILKHENKK